MVRTDPTALTSEEREVVALLERAHDLAGRHMPHRYGVAECIESALKGFQKASQGIPPSQLNATNDG